MDQFTVMMRYKNPFIRSCNNKYLQRNHVSHQYLIQITKMQLYDIFRKYQNLLYMYQWYSAVQNYQEVYETRGNLMNGFV